MNPNRTKRVYLASALKNAPKAHAWAVSLRAQGVEVVSTWHDQAVASKTFEDPWDPLRKSAAAVECMREMTKTFWRGHFGAVVFFDSTFASRGGLFELGHACGHTRTAWVEAPPGCGVNENVFAHLPGVERLANDRAVLRFLGLL